MLAVHIVLIVLAIALLVKGADFFVDGAAGIAGKCRIPPLVIGLTVVSMGTSMPELAVSVTSAAAGSTDLAVGNVTGSNIANILLILGVSALLSPLPVRKNSLTLDLPVLLLASVLLVALGAWGEALSRWDGLVFVLLFVGYLLLLIRGARRGKVPLAEPGEEGVPRTRVGRGYVALKRRTWFLVLVAILGLGMVVGGGTLLVESAKYVAREAGMSERVIGLTVVAVGTSLPELVTSVVAAAKKQTDIAVGNVIGSNLFNILFVAGLSALVSPLPFTVAGNLFDALVALAAVLLLFLLSLWGRKLGPFAGVLFLLGYAAYYVALFIPVA